MAGESNRRPRCIGVLLCSLVMAAQTQATCSLDAVAASGAPLIPVPHEVIPLPGEFDIAGGQSLTIVPDGAESVAVAQLLAAWLQKYPGLTTRQGSPAAEAPTVELRLAANVGPDDPEGYRLTVRPDGVQIVARDVRGLRYGAVTLWQLVASQTSSAGTSLRAMEIVDLPRFRWRGLMLDSARHYQPPGFIARFVDWMALHKLNVLHWHLTDDQAWRLEIRRYPRLTQLGAWRVPAGAARNDIDPATAEPRRYGGFYTQETVRELVRYAAERNVTIVPEIEMPGHATAALVAYPELAAGDGPDAVPADWGIYSNLFDVDEATFEFLENVLAEVIELFPGTYIHIGGDEVVKDQWRSSVRAQQWMRARGIRDVDELQSHFIARIGRFLTSRGRRFVGWDEILEGGLPPAATVMSWRGIEGARAAAQAGHDTVLAAWPTLYFDNRQGTGAEEPPGRGRVISLEDVYRFEPAIPGLTPAQQQHVLGLQGNLWTEHIRTAARVDWMAIPRAAAVAELAWSAAQARDFGGFRTRLVGAARWYRALGYDFATTEFRPPKPPRTFFRRSQELEMCTDRLVLNVEDDAPLEGERAVFLMDIMNPCWRYRDVDLSALSAIVASVGQVPFNFQLGADRASIRLREPRGRNGELEVRLDECSGELLAVLPLDPAVAYAGVTTLPPAAVEPRPGRFDLCLVFTGEAIDPMWAIDSIELVQRGHGDSTPAGGR